MKTLFKVLCGIFATIGVLAVATVLYFVFSTKYSISINKNENVMDYCNEYLDFLQSSGQYASDTTDFEIQIIQDSARAKEIRDYFKLDSLLLPSASTWEKALAIGRFVSTNIPHDNQKEWPEHVNAIGLWEYTKDVAPAFNCRLHSILTFELLLAYGFDAKYVTCMPQDENDNDCHVVNEIWLPELGKWAMLDTDMGGNFVTDDNSTPLSLKEMREHYISGEKMYFHPDLCKENEDDDWYYAYMAKNTYWFGCWGELSYYLEDWDREDVVRDHYINLIPSGFEPFRTGKGNTNTTDVERFWAKPTHISK